MTRGYTPPTPRLPVRNEANIGFDHFDFQVEAKPQRRYCTLAKWCTTLAFIEDFIYVWAFAPHPLYNIALQPRAGKNLGAAGEMVHHPGVLDTSRLNIIRGGGGGRRSLTLNILSYGVHLARRRWCSISSRYR